jgi:hypothetical protein
MINQKLNSNHHNTDPKAMGKTRNAVIKKYNWSIEKKKINIFLQKFNKTH